LRPSIIYIIKRGKMSVFRVKLSNGKQGLLDRHLNQRSAYIMGPNRVNRKLKDGEVFTDCNYWKRFAYPQVSLEEAFIEVVEDDGTIYSESLPTNTYPRVYNILAKAGSGFEENKADIAKESKSYATFAQITNKNNLNKIKIRLNSLNSAIIEIPPENTQVFNVGEVTIGSIEIDNSEGEEDVEVQIVVSIKSIGTS
jgi:hypothetical protein